MFEEIFRIIFDRRHIKDVRLWVLVILVIANVTSFWAYDKYVMAPVKERQERQSRRIKQIIKVAHLESKIAALPDEKGDHP